jgi:hypothetical protein
MMYDLLSKPPKVGSVLEALCLMIQMRRQLIQLFGMHTVVQAVRTAQEESSETIQESFNKYRDALLPFLSEEMTKETNEIIDALKAETSRGPMLVRKVGGRDQGSRLRKKLKGNVVRPPTAAWGRKKRW